MGAATGASVTKVSEHEDGRLKSVYCAARTLVSSMRVDHEVILPKWRHSSKRLHNALSFRGPIHVTTHRKSGDAEHVGCDSRGGG